MDTKQKNINGEVYTRYLLISPEWKPEIDIQIQKEIHDGKDFEAYYGVPETEELLHSISVNGDLFYIIYVRDSNEMAGYIGFTEREESWEPEIYIFTKYRRLGYATEVLQVMICGLFAELLMVERNGEKERVKTERIVSTVKKDNIVSQKLLEKIGFQSDCDIASGFMLLFSDEEDDESYFFEIYRYFITKNMFFDL